MPDGNEALRTGLVIAINTLHLDRVPCIRACRIISTMSVLKGYVSCEVLVWRRGDSADNIRYFTPEADDLGRNFAARALAQEVCEADKSEAQD